MKIILNNYPRFSKKSHKKESIILYDSSIEKGISKSRNGFHMKITDKVTEKGVTSYNVRITAEKDMAQYAGFGISFDFLGAKTSDYVFSPAALYNGNRFKKLKKAYPPMLDASDGCSACMETIISDVPALSLDGREKVNLNIGDMSTPCVGFFDQSTEKGFLLFITQKNEFGNYGCNIEENNEVRTISFSSPCVREKKYGMCNTDAYNIDKPLIIKKGMVISFKICQHIFAACNIAEFYRYFYSKRRSLIDNSKYPELLPFKKAYDIIEEKYNTSNWKENDGEEKYAFYRSSEASGVYSEWQTGWVGGAMNTLPMFVIGNDLSKKRSKKTLDFVFDKVQSSGGLLYGIFYNGKAYGDDFHKTENKNIVMSRKNADALYYLVKQLLYFKNCNETISEKWHNGVKNIANAIVRVCEKYGNFGQFLNLDSEEIIIGATASSGIVMAGLALSYHYFGDEQYLTCAKKLGDFYYEKYISVGLTNGGPGEMLQCPDSESAFGLLESYVVLYEITGEKKWKEIAENAARQCASWCVSYDYEYAAETQFAERGISTTGCVWANVQNKHAAPGICTLSGSSLLRLYRMTGDESYLTLLKDISHNITQYLGTEDRPMRASYIWHNGDIARQKIRARKRAERILALSKKSAFMKKILKPLYIGAFNNVGRINERANLSDWEGASNVGEIPHGSCWCEVSVMLTALEIPSIYIDSQGKHFVFDHLKADKISIGKDTSVFKLENPTKYDAEYTVFRDNGGRIIDMSLEKFERIKIAAGASLTMTL